LFQVELDGLSFLGIASEGGMVEEDLLVPFLGFDEPETSVRDEPDHCTFGHRPWNNRFSYKAAPLGTSTRRRRILDEKVGPSGRIQPAGRRSTVAPNKSLKPTVPSFAFLRRCGAGLSRVGDQG
jgi:hypothetical protein